MSILFCGVAWALALQLAFERLISIDLILYGASLLLEFVALAVLRFGSPSWSGPSAQATYRSLSAGSRTRSPDRLCALGFAW